MKIFGNSSVKSTSESYFWLANKVSTDSNEYFLKFSWKVFRISFRPKKSLLFTLKILKSFGNFLVKSTWECYFWLANKVSTDSNEYFLKFSWKVFSQKYIRMLFLANKVSTDSNEYFLKFSWKVFRISFRPKKSLLGHFWFKL